MLEALFSRAFYAVRLYCAVLVVLLVFCVCSQVSAGDLETPHEDTYVREVSLKRGDAYLAEKKYQHALNAYSRVILKEPKARVLAAYLGRVRALAGLQDIPKAADWARKATEAYPDSLDAWQTLGELYLTEHYLDPVRAEGIFRQMLALEPEHRAAHLYLARALSYLKKIEEAIVILKAWTEGHPRDGEVRYKLAESHFALSDHDLAEVELSTLLGQQPEHASALKLMSSIQSRKRWGFWLPVAALLIVPFLIFGCRHLKRGRIPKEAD